jgi:hypothetical protein
MGQGETGGNLLLSLTSESEPTVADLVRINDIIDLLHDYFELMRTETLRAAAGYRTIRILDFDMIYPACWPVQLRRPTTFERICRFPVTASFFFRETRSEFTIPPGTFFELSRYLCVLRDKLAMTAGELAKVTMKLEKLTGRGTKNKLKLCATELEMLDGLPDMVSDDIGDFLEAGVTFHALESLLSHPMHLAWEELTNRAESRISPEVLDRIWDALNYLRPPLTVNNFADALNISAMIALLESGSRTSLNVENRFFPLLATGTSLLREMNIPLCLNSLERRPYLGEDDRIVAVSPRYLLLDTAVSTYCEHTTSAKRTHVSVLLGSNHDVRKKWSDFWIRLWNKLPPRKSLEQVKLTDLADEPTFNSLMFGFDKLFHDRLSSILSVLESESRADKQRSDNFIEIRKRLTKGLVAGRRLEHLLSHEERILSAETLGQGSSLIKLFVKVLNDRHPIVLVTNATVKSLRQSKLLDDRLKRCDDTVGELLQFQPTCSYNSVPVLWWDGNMKTRTRQCVWNYSTNLSELMEKFVGFVRAVEDKTHQQIIHGSITVYGNGNSVNVAWPQPLSEEQLINLIVRRAVDPNYIRFENSVFDFYVELEPFDGESNSLELALRYDEDLNDQLADLHFQTAITRLDPMILVELLRDYDKQLFNGRETGAILKGGS